MTRSIGFWAGLVTVFGVSGCIIVAGDDRVDDGIGGGETSENGGHDGAGASGEGGGPADAKRLFVVNRNQGVASFAAPGSLEGRVDPSTNLSAGVDTDMYGPRDLAFGSAGELYVASENDAAVVVYAHAKDADGQVAPTRKLQGPSTGLDVPVSVAIDAEHDDLYVVNNGGDGAVDHSIFAFAGASEATGDVAWGRRIEVDEAGFAPLQVAFADGRLYAVTQDANTARVLVFDAASTLDGLNAPSRTIQNDAFGSVLSIFVTDDALYAVDEDKDVFVYDIGATSPRATVRVQGAEKLSGVARSESGAIFVSDSSLAVIMAFDGGLGDSPEAAPSRTFDSVVLFEPTHLAVMP